MFAWSVSAYCVGFVALACPIICTSLHGSVAQLLSYSIAAVGSVGKSEAVLLSFQSDLTNGNFGKALTAFNVRYFQFAGCLAF
jgi:hypothetical protein